MAVATVSPQQLHTLLHGGQHVDLIDVRTPREYCALHVASARNVPLDQLDVARVMAERADPSAPLYVICHSGARGSRACERFLTAGFANVINVEGGTMACDRAGLSVVRGKASISLQRQVQITAGSFAALGALLAIFVHPYWAILPAAVGAGLLYSGITDSCLLGLLLARMPWNQHSATIAGAAPPCCPDASASGSRCCG